MQTRHSGNEKSFPIVIYPYLNESKNDEKGASDGQTQGKWDFMTLVTEIFTSRH